MLQLESQSFNPQSPQQLKTAVMVIGGAEDKVYGREILQTFFRRAGAGNARIVIIPAASREPAVSGGTYQTIFETMGAKQVQIFDVRDRDQAEDPSFLDSLEGITGVFMTGGDQLRLCGLLAETALINKVRMLAKLGQITLAGTSAGAAVMGHHMIAGGGSGESPNRCLVDMAVGLGILPDLIVDQHFHNRNRMSRLMSAIANHPNKLGLGVDEDTCAEFEGNGLLQVIGKGTVTIIDPQDLFPPPPSSYLDECSTAPLRLHNLRVHILSHGDRFNLEQRVVLKSSYSS